MPKSTSSEFDRLNMAVYDAVREYDLIITEINRLGPSEERSKRLAAADRKERSAKRALDKYMEEKRKSEK